ncbi:hypothetical protein KL934_004558 [Ogataea polymorpha]|nr:hypothetical protein KL934_004558 [Ogataea polymorpha]
MFKEKTIVTVEQVPIVRHGDPVQAWKLSQITTTIDETGFTYGIGRKLNLAAPLGFATSEINRFATYFLQRAGQLLCRWQPTHGICAVQVSAP